MLNTIEQAEARAAAMRASWAGDTVLTPLGAATVHAYRLATACRELTPDQRLGVLFRFLESVSDQETRYTLMESRDPVRDPQLA
jgi:hypothetical protein